MSGNDTVYDALYSFGARSFSIWRADDMSLVYDSGDDLARKVAEFRPDLFNSNVKGSDNVTKSKDSRSDDKVKKRAYITITTCSVPQTTQILLRYLWWHMIAATLTDNSRGYVRVNQVIIVISIWLFNLY